MPTLLALDPGSRATGWAVFGPVGPDGGVEPATRLCASGTWRLAAPRSDAALCRYDQLADFVSELCRTRSVAAAVIEVPSGGQRFSATQLMTYARAVGTCEAACFLACRRVHRVPVVEWKGRVRKAEFSRHLAILAGVPLGQLRRRHDELDAIGLGMWWLQARKVQTGAR